MEPLRNIATIRLPNQHALAVCAVRTYTPPGEAAGPGGGAGPQGQEGADDDEAGAGPGTDGGAGGSAAAAAAAAAAGVTVVVATAEGLLYEYSLTDVANPHGPKCALEGEWSLLGSGTMG